MGAKEAKTGARAAAASPPPQSPASVRHGPPGKAAVSVSGPPGRRLRRLTSASFPIRWERASIPSAGRSSHPAPLRIASSAWEAPLPASGSF